MGIRKFNGPDGRTAWALTHIDAVKTDDGRTLRKVIDELSLGASYDVSSLNNGAVFSSLSALLNDENIDTLVPASTRKGGMSIKFIQGTEGSSDNKYVQYQLTKDTWSTDPDDWTTGGGGNYPPEGGVPKSDLSEEVQTSLDKADNSVSTPEGAGQPGQVLQLDSEGVPAWVTPSAGTTPDSTMSESSTNAVQNKVITKEILLGAVYDVSAKNPTAGSNNDGKWASLAALLSDASLSTLIPTSVRKGGMSVKFVQSSDNKYVQYFYIGTATTATDFTNIANWQGVVDDTVVRTGSYDATVAVGLADNLRGDTVVNAEFYKRKTGGTQSVGSGIATIKEMRGKSIVWNQILDADDWVDMGLPSGTLWCKKNLDATQPNGLAASEFQYECTFFSWGNKEGHNPVNGSFVNVYDWNQTNYDETEGAALTSDADIDYDGAIETIGGCFRDPSKDDFAELLNNIDFVQADGVTVVEGANKIVDVNGVEGIYLRSKINGNLLFFPRTGFGDGTTLNFFGGYYWTRSLFSQTNGYTMYFMSVGVRTQGNLSRYYGYARRPVLYKSTSTQDGKYNHKYAVYSNGKNLTDVTLMFGSGNEPSTVADFEKMFPLDRYDYNAGEVIPFAGQNLVTTGFNQWDEQWTQGDIGDNTGNVTISMSSSRVISKNYIKVIPNTTYNINGKTKRVYFYDENKAFISSPDWMASGGKFTTPNNAYLMLFKTATNSIPYNHDICINISDEDRNGTYEPYEKHTLPLDPSQWRDKQGNLVFPYGGMHGGNTVYDYAKVDADGYIRKAVRRLGQVDLGNLSWTKRTSENPSYRSNYINDIKPCAMSIMPKYNKTTVFNDISTKNNVYMIETDSRIYIADWSYTNVSTFMAAMQGVLFIYELAEPVEVELATPVYAKYLVDKDGTEEITPANGTKPYTTMANLSILYAMDARGEIKNLPKNYLSKESTENMLNAMVAAGVIASYTMTYDASSGRYQFVIVKP